MAEARDICGELLACLTQTLQIAAKASQIVSTTSAIAVIRKYDGTSSAKDWLIDLENDLAGHNLTHEWAIKNMDRFLDLEPHWWYERVKPSYVSRLSEEDADELWKELSEKFKSYFHAAGPAAAQYPTQSGNQTSSRSSSPQDSETSGSPQPAPRSNLAGNALYPQESPLPNYTFECLGGPDVNPNQGKYHPFYAFREVPYDWASECLKNKGQRWRNIRGYLRPMYLRFADATEERSENSVTRILNLAGTAEELKLAEHVLNHLLDNLEYNPHNDVTAEELKVLAIQSRK